MNEREKGAGQPTPCPNQSCREFHVVRKGSHQGRPRYHCRSCKTYLEKRKERRCMV